MYAHKKLCLILFVLVLGISIRCNAMENTGITRLIKTMLVAYCALFSSAGADAVTSETVPENSALYMTNAYFNTTNCVPRCVATADVLGPLQAVCVDDVGCENMYLSGAYHCAVDPDYVHQFECTVTHQSQKR